MFWFNPAKWKIEDQKAKSDNLEAPSILLERVKPNKTLLLRHYQFGKSVVEKIFIVREVGLKKEFNWNHMNLTEYELSLLEMISS